MTCQKREKNKTLLIIICIRNLLLNYLVQNKINNENLINNIESINRYFYNNLRFNVKSINKELYRISKNLNVIFINKFDYICAEEVKFCYGVDKEGKKLFFDYSHYTNEGAIFFGKKIYETGWLDLIRNK
jgi:hypothetical protein